MKKLKCNRTKNKRNKVNKYENENLNFETGLDDFYHAHLLELMLADCTSAGEIHDDLGKSADESSSSGNKDN
jgi:hypothetical protein